MQLLQQLASSNGAVLPGALSASKSSLVISDPIPGAKPLPVPPELAPFVGVSAQRPEGLWVWGGAPGSAWPPCNPAPAASPHSGCPPRRTRPS